MKRFISWSGGKDSTASIIICHEQGIPIDGVVMSKDIYLEMCEDFDAMEKERDNASKETAREILQELGEHTQRVKNLPNKVFSWKEKFERLEELIAEIYPRNYGVEVE